MKKTEGNRGAAVVEFAVLFLLLMIILFGIIEFGFIWLQSHYIANAAREGARVASRVDPTTTVADRMELVEDTVKAYLSGLPMYDEDKLDLDEIAYCCSEGDFIWVQVEDKTEEDADLVIDAGLGEENPPAIRVTVTVQTGEVWDPILWDLLRLIPGSTVTGDLAEVSLFAVFAVEEP